MAETVTGGCACGRVHYQVQIDDRDAYLCHCRMCQRASGAVSLALKSVMTEGLEWMGEPDWYKSSPIAERPYCAHCGTSLGFRYIDKPQEMDLTVGSFDDPFMFHPVGHYCTESMHREWIDTSGLPEKRIDEIPSIVDRWTRLTGRFPG